MKAIIWTRYGPPEGLKLGEVATPSPKDNEVLIRVHATTASTPDSELRRLKLPLPFAIPLRIFLGIGRPTRIKIPGTDFAGEIVEVGKDVSRFEPGQQVYGYAGLRMGTYAEYMCLAEKASALAGALAPKPDNLSYEEAVAIAFGGLEAVQALKKANIRPGQKVLVNGAGGSIGTCVVQLARHYGAEVTAVDHTIKLDMLRSIGADHVIDYTRQDFKRSAETYDVVLDTVDKIPFSRGLRLLKQDGYYLNANPGLLGVFRERWVSKRSSKKIIRWSAGYTTANLLALKALAEAGAIKPVIDRRYRLEQIAEAHRYVDSGLKKGNVVITIGD
jgi:NADPH:quinone reductase-like Zn-dependent oxidoreductase